MCSVTPKTGTALLFNHDTLHEGQPATAGSKYILRTEVMYRRVDTEMLLDPLSYLDDANYLRTLTLYQKSHQLEKGMYMRKSNDGTLQMYCINTYIQVMVYGKNMYSMYMYSTRQKKCL